MIDDLNDKMAQFKDELHGKNVKELLLFIYSKPAQAHGELLEFLPESIKFKLMEDRDEHGNLPYNDGCSRNGPINFLLPPANAVARPSQL